MSKAWSYKVRTFFEIFTWSTFRDINDWPKLIFSFKNTSNDAVVIMLFHGTSYPNFINLSFILENTYLSIVNLVKSFTFVWVKHANKVSNSKIYPASIYLYPFIPSIWSNLFISRMLKCSTVWSKFIIINCINYWSHFIYHNNCSI